MDFSWSSSWHCPPWPQKTLNHFFSCLCYVCKTDICNWKYIANVESKRLIRYSNGVHWPRELVVDISMTIKLAIKHDATIHVTYTYLSYSFYSNQTTTFEWFVYRCGCKNGTICFKCIHHSKISIQIIKGGWPIWSLNVNEELHFDNEHQNIIHNMSWCNWLQHNWTLQSSCTNCMFCKLEELNAELQIVHLRDAYLSATIWNRKANLFPSINASQKCHGEQMNSSMHDGWHTILVANSVHGRYHRFNRV